MPRWLYTSTLLARYRQLYIICTYIELRINLNTAVLYQHLIQIGHLFLTSGYTASILFVAFTKNVRKKSAFSHYIRWQRGTAHYLLLAEPTAANLQQWVSCSAGSGLLLRAHAGTDGRSECLDLHSAQSLRTANALDALVKCEQVRFK